MVPPKVEAYQKTERKEALGKKERRFVVFQQCLKKDRRVLWLRDIVKNRTQNVQMFC